MRRYFIDFYSDETLSTRQETYPIPNREDEVFVKGFHYSVVSILYDLDNNRVQIYLKKR
jgi:hypothetical protein